MIWERLFDLHLFYSVSSHAYFAYASLRRLCHGERLARVSVWWKLFRFHFQWKNKSISIIFQTNKNIQSSDYQPHICNKIKYEAAATELLKASPLSNSNEDYKVNRAMKYKFYFWNRIWKALMSQSFMWNVPLTTFFQNCKKKLYIQFPADSSWI